MAFFDDLSKNLDGLGRKLSQTGQEAVNKTKGMADTFKLNGQLNDAQNNLRDIYAAIGELYVNKHGNEPEDEYVSLINRAGQIKLQIAGLQEEIQKAKGIVVCPNCGRELKGNEAFCPACGSRVETGFGTAPQGAGMPPQGGTSGTVAQGTAYEAGAQAEDAGTGAQDPIQASMLQPPSGQTVQSTIPDLENTNPVSGTYNASVNTNEGNVE